MLVLALFHLWLAVLLPLGVDEAHYALYGWYPDWSYFDHPPLIGWLEAPAVHLLDSDWGVRLIPIVLGLVALVLLHRLTRTLFPEHPAIARWAVYLVLLSPLLHGMTLTPLPDLPLLILGTLLAHYLWTQRHQPRLQHVGWLGVLMGLAGLSKYTAITFVVSFVGVMALYGRWRWLRQPELWLAGGLALLLLSPVLYWNAQHDWASFLYQLHHGTRHPDWSWARFLISQGRQAGAYGPVLFLAGWGVILLALWRWRSLPEAARFMWLFAVPVWGLFAWSGGHEPILPHWTATGWWLIVPVVAWWLDRRPWALWLHGMLGAGLWLGLLHVIMTGQWGLQAPHPLLEVAGWEEAARRMHHWQQRLQEQIDQPVYQFAGNWSLVSRPAWYLRHVEDPKVFTADGRQTQFDFWFGRPPKGSGGVVLWHTWFDSPRSPAQEGLFERCRLLSHWPATWQPSAPGSEEPVPLGAEFRLYACQGWLKG